MCIVGGGTGLTLFFIFVVPLVVIISAAWRGSRDDGGWTYLGGLNNSGRHPLGLKNAWTCLRPNCRHRNMAGAKFCGRCGATRGYTYQVKDSELDSD